MRAFRCFWRHSAPPVGQSTPAGRRSQAPVGRLIWAAVTAVALGVPSAAQTPQPVDDLGQTLRRVGSRLEQWYSRAQTVVSRETVWIQALRADLTPVDVPRRLAYELRVDWNPERAGEAGTAPANVLREVLSVNGRPPERDRSDAGCVDPKPVSPEPLGILLPARLDESAFSLGGTRQVNGRPALLIDYRGLATVQPDIRWTGECVSVMLHGRSRGRIWVDADTYDVIRMDDRLVGTFEFDVPREHVRRGAARRMTIERAESSIRYRRVRFEDPDEALMVPEAIDTVTVLRGSGIQRFRISQRFSEYRRYVTAARLLY
jgi:hypothetical protein